MLINVDTLKRLLSSVLSSFCISVNTINSIVEIKISYCKIISSFFCSLLCSLNNFIALI